jgi:glyoxylase-like metal-dependent hydrolase (beta-lactamase superfamily II)
VEKLADNLWRWTARHPEWHPGEFGREVASFALREDSATILVDPLMGDDATRGALDALVAGDLVTILVTIPYHARSAAELARRWPRVQVLGHPATAKRLEPTTPFTPVAAGDALPHGVRAFAIGRPRRQELPLHLPSHRALAFGDAVVGAEGGLRVWAQGRVDERWYRERFLPTLAPLAELDVERVLVTHGPPVLRDGRAALREALAAPPWDPPRAAG